MYFDMSMIPNKPFAKDGQIMAYSLRHIKADGQYFFITFTLSKHFFMTGTVFRRTTEDAVLAEQERREGCGARVYT